jgi:dUTPase
LLVVAFALVTVIEVAALASSERDDRGFGSSG